MVGARAMTRNPLKRVVRSIRKHGAVRTARMAYDLSMRFLAHPVGNTRLYWAEVVKGGVVICNVQGSRMKLDLSDQGISRELYATGVHEPYSTRQFRKELKCGMVLLEVGANIGYYTLIALQHLVLQRRFMEGWPVAGERRRGAWHGSAGPVRYYPESPPATAAVQRARTVPGAASPAPPGTLGAGLYGASFPPQACCRLSRKAPASRHRATW